MTIAMLIVIVVLIASALNDAFRGAGKPVAGTVLVVVCVAAALLPARGMDWTGTIPYWVWPVLAAAGAVAVGVKAARAAATPAQTREAA
ncbi:hypothetical protein [Corynebacterium auris]|uniref:hypothetical protein n=1 Tax=Corynebacterium auris TaxID=44750 RepID=UPI0025B30420|nr:hypothetical protein [Corynebacterium auris]WJY67865.1 hypothetical protein CAURIS_04750 [Corynebacterium auris]